MSAGYPVAAGPAQAEIEIKKSRFIAWADVAENRAQALDLVARAKAQFPDARHHCWAYLIGSGHSPSTQAFSDDGEPSGTAGKPILNVLNHKAIGNLVVVVIRYFGGIKLGAGGLVRAYGQAAQAVIDQLPVREYLPLLQLTLCADYAAEQGLRHWLAQHGGALVAVDYQQGVRYTVQLPTQALEAFQQQVAMQGWHIAES